MPRTKTETVRAEPEGLLCRPDFISGDEERKVLDLVEGLEFGEVTMRGESASAPSSGSVSSAGSGFGFAASCSGH